MTNVSYPIQKLFNSLSIQLLILLRFLCKKDVAYARTPAYQICYAVRNKVTNKFTVQFQILIHEFQTISGTLWHTHSMTSRSQTGSPKV